MKGEIKKVYENTLQNLVEIYILKSSILLAQQ